MSAPFNFSAGPAMLPAEVMQQARDEFLNWNDLGISVMEISHRDPAFIRLAEQAEQDLRDLMAIPDQYKVLFMHGGGRGQFSAVPQNIAAADATVDYLNCGIWSDFAIREAQKYVRHVNVVGAAVQTDQGKAISHPDSWQLSEHAAYFHYCPNETVDGIAVHEIPQVNAPIVADMSSNILSEPLDVSKFGVIYAGAQKNIGPSGFAISIVREDLLGHAQTNTSTIMDYTVQAKEGSMYNTPNTFAWYLSALVFQWLKRQGGVAAIGELNRAKAAKLYHYIDQSDFYSNPVHPDYRSRMNIPFLLADNSLDSAFLKQAAAAGLVGLKGHRFVGGMRASIYNAMPMAGVDALVEFMAEFERKV
ncbi:MULTISPECIES: 3-phosphoserine/phosphohydroxythreonine transaminase [Idiomarina]|uniref:3-phosphoserine/phosphohydroxythreonine transaminase n=1 Tax=Idiomarina TaxID=135575 RepID=UPI00129A39D3|nr:MULTISPECIES: 3-phosphoserine/phosphohydroxythreonine transaminase [Idiomarina]MRJ40721.1 3-phosphoserine/phosphohydroxythreonine transaminase [Idiomarina sp. FeN1]NCU56525.1 3-phosphoserine/phosphohydroxythreonine transaminase [Idiomarina sp. FenA--70]NCU58905.1 3-phosphoserine/phosphohydroxythreonine transaminase [Idiomarina sp. FenBw--71]UUN14591.1 3-phosphoserine/phosphohydroxythreonine transaminase [Idiomarina loihiensis]